jgi:hypothetical protein
MASSKMKNDKQWQICIIFDESKLDVKVPICKSFLQVVTLNWSSEFSFYIIWSNTNLNTTHMFKFMEHKLGELVLTQLIFL